VTLAYFGWSAPFEHPSLVTEEAARDPEMWAQSNPALGIRISPEYITAEQRSMSARGFAVERLGVGDWPTTDPNPDRKIEQDAWDACRDPRSAPVNPVCLAFDTTPDRSSTAICAAGYRKDGLGHIEVVDLRTGTSWVRKRMVDLIVKHEPVGVVWAKGSPAASLVAGIEAELADRGIVFELTGASAEDHAKACGVIFDAITDTTLRHLGTTELGVAVGGAQTRKIGEAWLWSRASSAVSIAPLVAVTNALWGLATIVPPAPPVDLSRMRIRRV
jgi:hypothetical protein